MDVYSSILSGRTKLWVSNVLQQSKSGDVVGTLQKSAYNCKQVQEYIKFIVAGLELIKVVGCVQFIDGGTMVSPTAFARRSLSYLMNEMPNEALGDAMQALVVSPDWPTALYLQAASLFALGMENDAQESLKEATNLESKRNRK